jgi:hypothetical protein
VILGYINPDLYHIPEHKSPILVGVKKRPYGLPLLIKPDMRISRIRLSFGIVPLQEMDSSYDGSTGLVVRFPSSSSFFSRWRFSLLYFKSYLSDFFYPIDVIRTVNLRLYQS